MKFRHALCGMLAAALTTTVATAGVAGASSTTRRAVVDRESHTGETLSDFDALKDFDAREGTRWLPSAAARADLRTLPGVTARWTDFGTAAYVQAAAPEGWVDSGLEGAPKDAARAWIRQHKALFALTDADVTSLELVNDAVLTGTPAHAVLFRQRFGDLMSAQDGMITVAIRDGRIAIVTSSAVGHGTLAAQPKIGPAEAWVAAAKFAEQPVAKLADVVATGVEHTGFETFKVPGYTLAQRARLVAFATRTDGVRPAYETIVANNTGGDLVGYTSFVDAVTGKVWFRQNRVQTAAEGLGGPSIDGFDGLGTGSVGTPTGGQFQGKMPKGGCGPQHAFTLATPPSAIVAGVVTTPVPANNDTVIKLLYNGKIIASGDLLDGPEVAKYTQDGSAGAGKYAVQICAFASDTAATDYAGAYAVYDGPSPSPYPYPATWRVFGSNPLFGSSKDNRILACWDSVPGASGSKSTKACKVSLAGLASREPWDINPLTDQPSYTTLGNNAHSAAAWMAPGWGAATPVGLGSITPAEQYSPLSVTRDYDYPWTDQWRTSTTPQQSGRGCAPSSFTSAARVDVDAATANLFAMHNRMHDFAYYLGYTEKNFNHQQSNYGNTGPQYENDPQIGNAQAGAFNGGGAPSYGGRDNANQLTLNDGISPISNMYLWQAIAAAFYSACVDGDFDMSVIAHEYTHAISNRMVGGPDAGIGGEQGGAMGESWSDLVALEFLTAFGYQGQTGEGMGTMGAYVTGDKLDGIRDFNLDKNPLHYGDYGFDTTGAEVHADGEIWNATMWQLRKAWNKAYDSRYPSKSRALQVRCATGGLPADQCPGNRRWIQNTFDAFLIMPATVSMVDARDSMLAADKLRFGGKDIRMMWQVFANRGIGVGVDTASANDDEPKASFVSPYTAPASLKFRIVDDVTGKPVKGNVYVGRFEARVTPIADTHASTGDVKDTAKLAGGTYELVVQGDGYGLHRKTLKVRNGQRGTITFRLPRNLASRSAGASVTNDGGGLYASELIDDTESTDWFFVGASPVVAGKTRDPRQADKAIKNRSVTVNLTGGVWTIDRVTVSAAHRPVRATSENTTDPAQSRFSTLRQFAIDVSTDGKNFKQVYVSPANAFPGHNPRPRVPDLIFRNFKLPKPVKASHVRIRVLSNQCTGNAAWAGDKDADPANDTDCRQAAQAFNVSISELEVYAKPGTRSGPASSSAASVVTADRVQPAAATRIDAANAAQGLPVSPAVAGLAALAVVATAGAVWKVRTR